MAAKRKSKKQKSETGDKPVFFVTGSSLVDSICILHPTKKRALCQSVWLFQYKVLIMGAFQCESSCLNHSKFALPVAIECTTNAIRNPVKIMMRAFTIIDVASCMIEYLHCCLLVLSVLCVLASCTAVPRYSSRWAANFSGGYCSGGSWSCGNSSITSRFEKW